jgi:hypothetical protein
MSFHLAQLNRAGLVTSRREGRLIHYAADYGGMNGLLMYLTEDCCQGRPEICSGVSCIPEPSRHDIKQGENTNEAPSRIRRR